MNTVVVRCGRCRAELEIPGPGEFVCPACGTRNVAGGGAAADPYTIGGAPPAASRLTVPGGAPVPMPQAPPPDVHWAVCPSCSFRFATGEVETLVCPNCRATLARAPDGAISLSG